MNTVRNLQIRPFNRLSLEEKLEVKRLGPDRPDLSSSITSKSTRRFTSTWYSRYDWLTGCNESGKIYCFPCMLFGGALREKAWTQAGVSDWKHLSDKVKRHVKCSSHVENCLKLAFFGQSNIKEQLSQAYRASIQEHNIEVKKNRHVLSKLMECIKFCGAFELALRGHDETEDSDNPGIFRGLINFTAALDSALSQHLESATVFKGTSKTIQNELLDIMYETAKNEIKKEINKAKFVAVISDDTTDVSSYQQNVVVFRYIADGKVVERFWSFGKLPQGDAETISTQVLSCIGDVLPKIEDKYKLISQSYDGAPVMSGSQRSVQSIVKDAFPNAHYVHCYAHQLNLVLHQVASQIPSIRIFFANLNGFSDFFYRSTKRIACLDECAAKRIPRSVQTRWNFQSRIVSTVFEHKASLIACFEKITLTWKGDEVSVCKASGLLRWLKDKEFLLFLEFFSQLMPHVDILYAQLQKWQICPTKIKENIQNFIHAINGIRDKIPDFLTNNQSTPSARSPRLSSSGEENFRIFSEVCDIIISHCCSRFAFSEHLVAATLFDSQSFAKYDQCFPTEVVRNAVKSFPFLDGIKLQSELKVIYCRQEFRSSCGSMALLQLLMESNLADTFSETVELLKVLNTIPMTSCEVERCFSTLKRIKTFLINTMAEERLNALAMLSIEKNLIRDSVDFNRNVIDSFANLKNRRAKFLYKK